MILNSVKIAVRSAPSPVSKPHSPKLLDHSRLPILAQTRCGASAAVADAVSCRTASYVKVEDSNQNPCQNVFAVEIPISTFNASDASLEASVSNPVTPNDRRYRWLNSEMQAFLPQALCSLKAATSLNIDPRPFFDASDRACRITGSRNGLTVCSAILWRAGESRTHRRLSPIRRSVGHSDSTGGKSSIFHSLQQRSQALASNRLRSDRYDR